MKSGPGGIGIMYEHGVDFYNLDISGFEDIANALKFSLDTSLNLLTLPKDLQEKIQQQRNDNTQISLDNADSLKISLKVILDELGIEDYEIIFDNNHRSIERSKKRGVTYIGSMNLFGDFNIQSINKHINESKAGYMNQDSFRCRKTLPYVLFYDRMIPPTILERVVSVLGINRVTPINEHPLLHK